MTDLRRVDWPMKFRPDLPKKYDGTIDPEEFLQIYTTAIQAPGHGQLLPCRSPGDRQVLADESFTGICRVLRGAM